jgi:preprotein translocase subunit SecA
VGQKDPLLEYKQEAYTMFVDLMNDIAETFTDRFLKVQLVIERAAGDGRAFPRRPPAPRRRRAATTRSACWRTSCPRHGAPRPSRVIGRRSAETPAPEKAGRASGSRDRRAGGARRSATRRRRPGDGRLVERWTERSLSLRIGKKFKKCHGATL